VRYYEFPCGCKFPIQETILSDGRPSIKFDANISKLPMDCERTWDLISEGNTKGVFQLESRSGQSFAKKLKPRNIEHLSALVAIIRPGCLEAMRDGKNITEHYIARKNGDEPVTLFHPALESALAPTYGEMIYQEQAMQIARDIAGFDLQQADVLRKAIGKKKAKLMAEVKEQFLTGAATMSIVNKDQAEEIFGWIEKSQRYSFNKSHSVSYAINAYLSAYAKAHFPKAFFTSYLYYAQEKQKPLKEVNELANNAKTFDIEILTPSIAQGNQHFKLVGNDIYVGISDIKGLGKSVVTRMKKLQTTLEERFDKPLVEFDWLEILIFMGLNINSSAMKALISVGAFSHLSESRTQMLHELEAYASLSNRERTWCESYMVTLMFKDSNNSNFTHMLLMLTDAKTGKMGGCANKNRLEKVKGIYQNVKEPPYSMEDSAAWIAMTEEKYLGLSITCAVVESCDISAANCTCKEFLQGYHNQTNSYLIAATIDESREIKTKRGKTPGQLMAFLVASDITGNLDGVVAFPDVWAEYKRLLAEGNTVMLCGERGTEQTSLLLKKVYQI